MLQVSVSRGGVGSVLPHVAEVNETSWLAGLMSNLSPRIDESGKGP